MAVKKKSSKKPAVSKAGFMGQQAEEDAQEAKIGEAAKETKRCHLLSKECEHRLRMARMATSTTDAIQHDLERVLDLAADISQAASAALKLLRK